MLGIKVSLIVEWNLIWNSRQILTDSFGQNVTQIFITFILRFILINDKNILTIIAFVTYFSYSWSRRFVNQVTNKLNWQPSSNVDFNYSYHKFIHYLDNYFQTNTKKYSPLSLQGVRLYFKPKSGVLWIKSNLH